jgi:Cellulase (glycosyl hydrolase family 5)
MSYLFGPSLMLAAFAALACTAPTPTLVARERPKALGSIVTDRARGRVSVVDGRVVTDIGTPLRGLTLPVDFDPKLEDFELMTTIAQTTGLNTVHVYLENWEIDTGARQAEADALVSLTAQAGLYLVLGIGGGKPLTTGPNPHPGNGWFDAEKVAAFWTLYAKRYASSTHVLFEIQNNPELTCDDRIQRKTLDLERTMYTLIRGLAPDSHIVLFSTSSVPRQAVVEQAIDDVSAVVDFSNASFAMHIDDVTCTPPAGLGAVFAATRAKQVPVLITALPNEGWPEVVENCEAADVGWFHHRWLAYEPSLDSLFTEMSAAKLSWCPDQGNYPAASGCR